MPPKRVELAFLRSPSPIEAPKGTLIYCSDCAAATTCAGGGTGALAKHINGAWVCN